MIVLNMCDPCRRSSIDEEEVSAHVFALIMPPTQCIMVSAMPSTLFSITV